MSPAQIVVVAFGLLVFLAAIGHMWREQRQHERQMAEINARLDAALGRLRRRLLDKRCLNAFGRSVRKHCLRPRGHVGKCSAVPDPTVGAA